MNDNERDIPADKEDDKDDSIDLPASIIIGANIGAANAGTYPGGVVAPAADAAAKDDEDEDEDAEVDHEDEVEADENS